MASAETKASNAGIILDVLAAKGGDGRFLHAIATRESGLNHAVRHELPADVRASRIAWERNYDRYRNNPYYNDFSLWDHGKGLFGMVPANHLFRWDPTAHPDVLFNPYVASVTAARLVQRSLDIGAQSWADVDQVWATGKPARSSSWEPRRQRMISRLRKLGYPTSLVDESPEPGGWGRGPQPDQLEVLWLVHSPLGGSKSSGASKTSSASKATSSHAPNFGGAAFALLGIGGLGALAYAAMTKMKGSTHVVQF